MDQKTGGNQSLLLGQQWGVPPYAGVTKRGCKRRRIEGNRDGLQGAGVLLAVAAVYGYALMLGALILVLYVPYLRDLFQVAALSLGALLVCLVAALAGVLWFEVYKYSTRGR